MNRFVFAACIVTVAAMLSGWAHATEPVRKCNITSTIKGATVIKCPNVVVKVSR